MIQNIYTEQVLSKQKQKEMLELAEQARLVDQVIRWLKQDAQKAAKSTDAMKTPEVNIHMN